MNAEISKIRKYRNYGEEIKRNPTRIKENRLIEMSYQLNTNLAELYSVKNPEDVDIDLFANKFINNIYIILNAFNEMGIYPDYFYDEIVKLKTEYNKLIETNANIRNDYKMFKDIKTSIRAKLENNIGNGMEKKYYHIQAYQKKDINDNFLEMIGFFQAFNIPYGVNTKENCLKVFEKIHFNHTKIMEELINADMIYEDIECLVRLLFEYIYFFVSMGINPKELLDDYIDSVENMMSKAK